MNTWGECLSSERGREKRESEILCSPGIILTWVKDGPGTFPKN